MRPADRSLPTPGQVNQLSGLTCQLSAAAEPLRDLMKSNNTFMRTAQHGKTFFRTKDILYSPPILS